MARTERERARILGVTKSTGGVAVYNRTLSEQLRDRGYDVSAICLSEGKESYAHALEARGIPTTSMDMARYSIAPVSDLQLAGRLIRHVRRHAVDLIVAHGAKAGFLSRVAGRVGGVPVVYVMHSLPFLRRIQGRRAPLYRQLERIGVRLGGHVVAISHSMRDELARRGVAPTSAVTVIHTGIDPSKLRPSQDRSSACRAFGLDPHRPVIGWAGRLNPQKAPLDLVRAGELVARTVPDVQLLMAGEGPLAHDVRALADRIGLGNRLIMVGWQEDVAAMFPALDVYAAASHWEGLPLTLLEAMAAERPAVVTAVDGVVEVIRHGVDGFLVDAGDVRAMARHLELLLLDERRRAEVGRAARERVLEHFTVERMMERWVELIDRELSSHRQPLRKHRAPGLRAGRAGSERAALPAQQESTPRIALYLPSLSGGGAERVMVTLANAFCARGFSVDMVLASASGPYIEELDRKVRVVDLDARRVSFSLPALARYLRREQPQAMLSALHHANVVAIRALRRAAVATRLVVTEHNTLTVSMAGTRLKRLRFWLMRRSYPLAGAVVAVSDGVANDLADAIGLPRRRIQVIYNPIVTPQLLALSRAPLRHPWLSGEGPPVILAAGRLTAQKDFSTLIRAFARVRAECPARLLILGEGEQRDELQALAAELGQSEEISMPGFVANPFAWMRHASLFVLSSAWEGLPSTLIEAMACGTAVVSTNCPSGPAEILDGGRWGRLVPVGDAAALATAITAALADVAPPDVAARAAAFGVKKSVTEYLGVLGAQQ